MHPKRLDGVEYQSMQGRKLAMRNSLNLCRLTHRLIMLQPAFRVNEVRREDSIDQGALAETSLSDDHDVELKASFEQLVLNLAGDGVETDVGSSSYFLNGWGGHGLS